LLLFLQKKKSLPYAFFNHIRCRYIRAS
jgi:hypothetical protein